MSGTISMLLVAPAIEHARSLGVDVTDVLRRIGSASGQLDLERRVEYAAAIDIWNVLARRSGEAAFGARAAFATRPGSLDVHEYIVQFSATLGEGFRRLSRFIRLLSSRGRLEVHTDARELRIVNRPPGRASAVTNEFIVCLALALARRAAHADVPVKRLELMDGTGAGRRTLEAIVGCTVVTGQKENAVVFPRAVESFPLPGHDERLVAILERHAQMSLEELRDDTSTVERVRSALFRAIGHDELSLEGVARTLGTSSRSLQRELHEGGTSFRTLVDEVRHRLAVAQLEDARLPITAIAFELGFSDVSAFNRSFRRWTGKAPSAFRATAGSRAETRSRARRPSGRA